mmetsp:Transcript_12342/g.30976  ORF Transcript_12342/g.30976 Transcript_12342/m.30976 type:complete len:319 (+) Transcript_12342:68-1024(+)
MRHMSLLKGVASAASARASWCKGRTLLAAFLLTGGAAVQAQGVHTTARCEAPNPPPPREGPELALPRHERAVWLGGGDIKTEFWAEKWQKNEIGFHLSDVHPQLVKYGNLMLEDGVSAPYFPKRILIPLCGKTLDMPFLVSQGHDVTGVELIRDAMDDFVKENGVTNAPPETTKGGMLVAEIPLKQAKGKEGAGLRFVIGDFFKFSNEVHGTYQACFDRGSLVAIDPSLRGKYADVLSKVMVKGSRVLLVTVEHGGFRGGKLGPPFSVPPEEVERLFATRGFKVESLMREDRMPLEPSWAARGATEFHERTWLLTKLK